MLEVFCSEALQAHELLSLRYLHVDGLCKAITVKDIVFKLYTELFIT